MTGPVEKSLIPVKPPPPPPPPVLITNPPGVTPSLSLNVFVYYRITLGAALLCLVYL